MRNTITQKHKTGNSLLPEDLKTYYENILASIQDGVIVVSNECVIITFNPAIEEMSGISSSYARGQSLQLVFSDEPRLIELTIKTISTGTVYSDSDFQIFRRGDKKVFPVSLIISPLSDERGDMKGAILVVRDMTRAKELEESLRKADRFASLGLLAAGMAHEIKNPLGGLRGAAQLLNEEIKNERYSEYTQVIIKEADRVNSIVEDLFTLSNPRPPELRVINIHEILESILLLEKKALKKSNIEVVQIYDPSLPAVMVDEGQITQVFLNIIKNAVESMPAGGELTIITRIFYDYIIIKDGGKSQSKMVLVEVKDTGKGFQEDIINHLFTPFFSTKSKGIGLGLAISHKIVEEHKGMIKVLNRTNGKGATLQVFLPISSKWKA